MNEEKIRVTVCLLIEDVYLCMRETEKQKIRKEKTVSNSTYCKDESVCFVFRLFVRVCVCERER